MIEILLSLILALTGIARDVDPELTAIAQRRVVEIQSDFSHNGQASGTYEIIAWNNADDVARPHPEWAAYAWMDSATHRAVLTNPNLTRIGCAIAETLLDTERRKWYACVLMPGVQAQSPPQVSAPANEAPVVMLPNTAMPHEEER